MDEMPEVTTLDQIEKHSAYQALEVPVRPSWWGVDLEMSRRPGVPSHAKDPKPMPNARLDIEPMQAKSATPMHGRPNKQMPPVYGTAEPMRGLSGVIKRAAAKLPDRKPEYWLLKMLSDRVDSWGYHLRKYALVALPLGVLAFLLRSRD